MRSLLLFSALTVGLVACGGEDPDPTAGRPDALGPFAVGYLSTTQIDGARGDRSLLMGIWYPVDAQDAEGSPPVRYPLAPLINLQSEVAVVGAPVSSRADLTLLVFSHGYGGIHLQSVELMEMLASHGFVVVSPEHTGNAQSSNTDTFDEAAANRVPDVSFIIDMMFARNGEAGDEFFERLDESRVGVVGHSFGGMTAIGMAAGWAGAPPDPRVTAIVPISAVIDGDMQSDMRTGPNRGFTPEQLAPVAIPVMLVGGTEDDNVPVGNNALAFDQMTSSPAVYQVDIIGANHTHFSNVCTIGDLLIDLGVAKDTWSEIGAEGLVAPYESTCGPDAFPVAEVTRLQNLFVVSFFRHHLLEDAAFESYLTEDAAAMEPAATLRAR